MMLVFLTTDVHCTILHRDALLWGAHQTEYMCILHRGALLWGASCVCVCSSFRLSICVSEWMNTICDLVVYMDNCAYLCFFCPDDICNWDASKLITLNVTLSCMWVRAYAYVSHWDHRCSATLMIQHDFLSSNRRCLHFVYGLLCRSDDIAEAGSLARSLSHSFRVCVGSHSLGIAPWATQALLYIHHWCEHVGGGRGGVSHRVVSTKR